MVKISQLPNDTTPANTDFLAGYQGSNTTTSRFSIANLLSIFSKSTNFTNPYKFSVYRNAAWTTANNAEGKVAFDTKVFDTSTNFDVVTNNRFVAPIAGFYFFSGKAESGGTNNYTLIYKNGSVALKGPQIAATNVIGGNVSGLLQLTTNDYVELYHFSSTAVAGITGADKTYFQGFLVSAT